MTAINQNPESDSLKISQNEDGTFTIDWDPKDPNWSFLNNLTSKEIQDMVQKAIDVEIKKHVS